MDQLVVCASLVFSVQQPLLFWVAYPSFLPFNFLLVAILPFYNLRYFIFLLAVGEYVALGPILLYRSKLKLRILFFDLLFIHFLPTISLQPYHVVLTSPEFLELLPPHSLICTWHRQLARHIIFLSLLFDSQTNSF